MDIFLPVVPFLRAILFRHGNIAAHCTARSMQFRSNCLVVICDVTKQLQATQFHYLTSVEVSATLSIVDDLENLDVEVGWLRKRLDEILVAMRVYKYANRSARNLTSDVNMMITRTVESLAARANISAHETVAGQHSSSADFISSMTSNPRAEFLLGIDIFSLIMLPVLSRSSEASQPYKTNKILFTT
ncbi:Phospholipase-like [Dillenia turbinata]|uniref:Phospholipase-like n=1 Tax=Dillenia turbinata TaxID=194707 RepID=A0AAN8V6I5_9MAGN